MATPIISSAVEAVLDRATDEIRQAFADAVDAQRQLAVAKAMKPGIDRMRAVREAEAALTSPTVTLAKYDWELPLEAARVAEGGAR